MSSKIDPRNNAEKFGPDFMFELTQDELDFLRSNNLTANISPKSRYLPKVFTEQGVYMLMTILKGELATRQSIALIRTFKVIAIFKEVSVVWLVLVLKESQSK